MFSNSGKQMPSFDKVLLCHMQMLSIWGCLILYQITASRSSKMKPLVDDTYVEEMADFVSERV